jgi:phage-related tail protein
MVEIIVRKPEPPVMEEAAFEKLVRKTAAKILGQGRPLIENTGMDINVQVDRYSESFTLTALTNNANTPTNLEQWVTRKLKRLADIVGGDPDTAKSDNATKRKRGRPRKDSPESVVAAESS